jgi:DNA-binding NtrC family response regulator
VIYTVMAAAGVEWFTASHISLLASIAAPTAVTLGLARYVGWLEGENRRLTEAINVEHDMIGRSEKMQEIYREIGRVGPSKTTVLITGESGTGKELVAQAIHRNSPRAGKGLYAVNCGLRKNCSAARCSDTSGARSPALTAFEKACSRLPTEEPSFLTKSANVRRRCRRSVSAFFRRVNSNVKARTPYSKRMSASLPLRTLISRRQSRKDGFVTTLFYRPNLVQIHMPRLADRREDIRCWPHFIKKHGYIRTAPYPPAQGITPEAHRLMASYDWPGNVRELETVIQVAITLGSSLYIGKDDLPNEVTGTSTEPTEFDFEKEMHACKKALYEQALLIANGDRKAAARLIGVHPTHLAFVCKQLDIRSPRV